jgi:hypothetical protein
MRWHVWTAAALGLTLLGSAKVTAQTPANYNYDRAQRHFLASRYSYRTMYSSTPGMGNVTVGPNLYKNQFIEPSYSRQWITPRGYERFDAIPGLGGTTVTPFGVSSYYVPGFGYGYAAPLRK